MNTLRIKSWLETAARLIVVTTGLCWIGCEVYDYYEDPGPFERPHGAVECSIVLGRGDETLRLSADLDPNGRELLASLASDETDAWSTVLETQGPCHFTLYDTRDLRGRSVTLGAGISTPVFVGRDGFRYGGSYEDVWKARSLLIERPSDTDDEACEVRLGMAGAAATYFANVSRTPAFDTVVATHGRNCRFTLYDPADRDPARYKYVFPGIASPTRVHFPIDSLGADALPVEGPCFLADSGVPGVSDGRCLPAARPGWLEERGDLDEDGIADALEDWLAKTFRPLVRNDSNNNTSADAIAVYAVRRGEEPATFVISGYLLWAHDGGYVDSWGACAGDTHVGDASTMEIVVRAKGVDGALWFYPTRVVFWETRGGDPMPGAWTDGRPASASENTGVNFVGTRPEVFFSGGKHHPYFDTSWDEKDSPYSDWGCNDAVDGHGTPGDVVMFHETACEDGLGARVAFHNVGSAERPLLFSPAQAFRDRPVFHDYDLWQDVYFCGTEHPADADGQRGCTGTVLAARFKG